jgi:hypothetical protein
VDVAVPEVACAPDVVAVGLAEVAACVVTELCGIFVAVGPVGVPACEPLAAAGAVDVWVADRLAGVGVAVAVGVWVAGV